MAPTQRTTGPDGQTLNLAQALGLRPLDRLQINSKRFLVAQGLERSQNKFPYWFFQRVTQEGLLEVMAPGGSIQHVGPTEVCNVVEGVRLVVRAMPRATFLQRSSLPPSERQQLPPDAAYAPAYVRFVRKDRWNRIDQVFVQFHADSLNESPTFASPIHQEDRAPLGKLATRRSMPIVGPVGASMSADNGIQRILDAERYAAAAFIRASLAGMDQAVDALSQVGVRPLSARRINSLFET